MTSEIRLDKAIGPYRLAEYLGGSPTGSVFRAQHRESGQEVALRLLPPAHDDQNKRYMQELNVVLALDHPHLVPFYEQGIHEDMVYVSMRMMHGGSLRGRIHQREAEKRPMPSLGEVAQVLEQMASALDYLHGQGITHHHVDPRNIMLDDTGKAYLADTGVAKLFKVAYSLKTTGSVSSHKYSPPEQWLGENVGPASDQYSLGATLYLMLTGKAVFEASSILGLMQQHLNDTPTPPHYIRQDVPAAVTIPLLWSLAKTPEGRYPTLRAFYEAFAEAIRGADSPPTGFFTFPLRKDVVKGD